MYSIGCDESIAFDPSACSRSAPQTDVSAAHPAGYLGLLSGFRGLSLLCATGTVVNTGADQTVDTALARPASAAAAEAARRDNRVGSAHDSSSHSEVGSSGKQLQPSSATTTSEEASH